MMSVTATGGVGIPITVSSPGSPMSLMPAVTITCVTPVLASTSRSRRACTLSPKKVRVTWLPEMPALSTPARRSASNRSARKSV